MRLQCVTLPLSAWIIITNMMLQTIGKPKEASVLSLSRQGLFFLPVILVLPHMIGLLGIQASQPIADIATFILSLSMGVKAARELRLLQQEQDQVPNGQEAASPE